MKEEGSGRVNRHSVPWMDIYHPAVLTHGTPTKFLLSIILNFVVLMDMLLPNSTGLMQSEGGSFLMPTTFLGL